MNSLIIAGTAALALTVGSGIALAASTTPGQQPYQYNVGNGAARQDGQKPYQYSVGNGAARQDGQKPYQYSVGNGAAQPGQKPYEYSTGNGAAQKSPGGQYTQGGAGKTQAQQKSNQ